jgi:hypothetical protein
MDRSSTRSRRLPRLGCPFRRLATVGRTVVLECIVPPIVPPCSVVRRSREDCRVRDRSARTPNASLARCWLKLRRAVSRRMRCVATCDAVTKPRTIRCACFRGAPGRPVCAQRSPRTASVPRHSCSSIAHAQASRDWQQSEHTYTFLCCSNRCHRSGRARSRAAHNAFPAWSA